jgi:hypothetical protein
MVGWPTHSRVSNEWATIDQLEATRSDWRLQFIPTHSNVRNEWGTRQQPQAFPPTRGKIEDWRWVFVDETWCNTQMSRYWRWAERGVRVPQN